jgi:hypothetical protein
MNHDATAGQGETYCPLPAARMNEAILAASPKLMVMTSLLMLHAIVIARPEMTEPPGELM